jgi:predicted N-acetyltransferase YhbS
MSHSNHLTIRGAQPDEMAQVGALVARVFSENTPHLHSAIARSQGEALLSKPGFLPAMCRIALADGLLVSHARAESYTLRYGSAELRVAGLGAVCTHPDYRARGYSSAVMLDALAYMAEQGAHLALLHTTRVEDYYQRFGFSPVWPTYYFEVDTADAALLQARLPMRTGSAADAPYMADLYERHWGARVAFTRSPENWLWRFYSGLYESRVVENPNGMACGYVAGYDVYGEQVEVVADTPDAAVTLLAEYGRAAHDAGIAHIRWLIPPDDALVTYARLLIPVTVSARYRPGSGWMARMIDTQGLLDALLPEILTQATIVLPALNARDLMLHSHPDVVEIGWRGYKSTFCQLNHQDFIQVMFGTLRPSALALRPHSGLDVDAVRLLEALFPPRMAALSGWDWF